MEIALGKHLTPRVPKVGITITKSHCPWSCSCMNKRYKMEAFVLENNFTFTYFVIGNSLKTFLLCNPVSWNLHTKFKAIVDRMVTSIPKRSLCPNLWALWRFDFQRLLGFGEWKTQEPALRHQGVNTSTNVLVWEGKKQGDLCWQNSTRKSPTILNNTRKSPSVINWNKLVL